MRCRELFACLALVACGAAPVPAVTATPPPAAPRAPDAPPVDPSGDWELRWDRGFARWKPPVFNGKLSISRNGEKWSATLKFKESVWEPEFVSLKVEHDQIDLLFQVPSESKPGKDDLELFGWIRDGRLVGEMRGGDTIPWTPCGGRRAGAASASSSGESTSAPAPTTKIDGWSLSGNSPADYEIHVDPSVKHGGRASGSLRSTAATPNGFGTLAQIFAPESFAGKRVRLSAWIRSASVTRWAGLWMRVDREGGKMGAFDNMQGRPIKGTSDWTKYEVVLDVAHDAVDVAFGVLIDGAGQVWIDDVTFEVVSRDVPTTGGRPADAVNLDFEVLPPASGTAPEPWTRWGDEFSEFAITSDTNVKHAGRASGRIESVTASPRGFGALTQTIAATKYLGKRVRLRAFLKTDAVARWAGLWMRVDDNDGYESAFDNMQDRPIKGTTDWAPYEVVLEVAPTSKDIAFGSVLANAGKVWMDDATLTVVDSSVAMTGQMQKVRGSGAKNLGFEQ